MAGRPAGRKAILVNMIHEAVKYLGWNHLIGPCILPGKLTGPRYLRHLRGHLP
jgi:hypothetical protein